MTRGERTIRIRAIVGIASTSLRRAPIRTGLLVLAIALAVLTVTLLGSLGVGVVDAGEDGLEGVDRDIWISSDPVDPSASGTANPIVGSHGVASEVAGHDDVRSAAPLVLQEVYVGTDDRVERTSAVGVHQTHDGFDFEAGGGFDTELNHTAGEAPIEPSAEPSTEDVVLDPNTAATLGVSVGDTVFVGGSRETAPDHEFTVVGISSYYSGFLGADAQAVPLLDLQAVTGTAVTDRATYITVSVESGADPEAVAADLDAAYPDYDVRTSEGQMRAMLDERPVVLASGVTLVVLATLAGLVLTINLFTLLTYQQRSQLAALHALGLSRWVLAGTIGVQGVLVGIAGGLVGVAATPPLVAVLNRVAGRLVDLDPLLRTPVELYLAGLALAVVVGTVVALVTSWRAAALASLDHLDDA